MTNSEGTFLYGYDAENRLTSSEKQYQILESYYWDGDYIIRADRYTSGSSEPTWFYIRGNELISKTDIFNKTDDQRAASDYYYVQNRHGDVVNLVNASGTVVNSYAYDSYGNITEKVEGTYNPFKYAGELQTMPNNMVYLRNRIYVPEIGRFLTEDPHWNTNNMIYGDNQKAVKYAIVDNKKLYYDKYGKVIKTELHSTNILGLSNVLNNGSTQYSIQFYNIHRTPDMNAILQSANLYVYVMNNPLMYTDPTGEIAGTLMITAPKWVPLAIVGITAAAAAITGYFAHNNQKSLEEGMSKNQKELFQREIEAYKKSMGRGPGDHLPWEILVELAEEIRKNYK